MAKRYDRFNLDKVPKSLAKTILDKTGQNWKPKHYLTSPHCKVCRLPVRCEVEELLYVGVTYDDIAGWCRYQGYDGIKPSDVSKHYKAHCNWQREVQERGVAQYVSWVRRNEVKDIAEKVSADGVLDGIIQAYAEKFNPDNTPVKTDEVIKAIKVQKERGGGTSDPIMQVFLKGAQISINARGTAEEAIDGEVVEE
ncbi:MAG: hypothetical protein WC072_06125 [Methanoregulaceae archaeon]